MRSLSELSGLSREETEHCIYKLEETLHQRLNKKNFKEQFKMKVLSSGSNSLVLDEVEESKNERSPYHRKAGPPSNRGAGFHSVLR